MTKEERKDLIIKYLPLAKKLARHQSRPKNITLEELQSAAYLGLCDAASRYKDGPFNPTRRIKGEMIDYLRSVGWGSRANKKSSVSIDLVENFLSYTVDYSSRLEQKELLETLKFSPLEMKALILYNVEEHTLQQVAQEVDMSISGVWKMLQKCTKEAA